jgi:pimeloyl-ACP methyl ester carboxylesterase
VRGVTACVLALCLASACTSRPVGPTTATSAARTPESSSPPGAPPAPAPPSRAAEAAARSVHTRPCSAGHRLTCGSIRVPLFWSRPEAGRSLTVHFRIYPHTDRSARGREPVVGFEGGPGYATIPSASTYRFMMGSFHAQHDLLVMDNRGTGLSNAIACRKLQKSEGPYVGQVDTCAEQLGDAAGAYGTAAVADDLHAILVGLEIAKVDLYGDSYGTYSAQVFTLRHPDQVRATVLDGAFDDSFDPFFREASATMRTAWRTLCRRAGTCPGILTSINRLARRLETHPLSGAIRANGGALRKAKLTATGLAQLVYDATYTITVFQDLPAAIRSYQHGDEVPLLRLAAEDLTQTGNGGSPAAYSAGDYMAVSCNDYPTVWNRSASPADRRRQLERAIARLPADTFAPFPKQTYLDSLYEYQLVYGCLDWPKPDAAAPPEPTDTAHPDTPVLVLVGEFDQATPPQDSRAVARAFPNATFVEVPNEVHISGLYDYQRCASRIARHFLRRLKAGDTSCTKRLPTIPVEPDFPETLSRAPQARPAGGDDGSIADDRRAAWVANATLGDALTRWWNVLYTGDGVGLRGGSFHAHGTSYTRNPLRLTFDRTRFVDDMSISGTAVWNRETLVVHAHVHVDGPDGVSGELSISMPTTGGDASVHGSLGGREIDVRTPASFIG